MRSFSTTLLLLIAFVCYGQDWALINPAYRYNYSNDGTDTISNQIRVMDIDTLGPDSFRYAFNLVAEMCGPCSPGCSLLTDIPQFSQAHGIVGARSVILFGPDSLILHPKASSEEQWIFVPENGTEVISTTLSEELILGTLDSVRTIITTADDTVQWSKEHGIILWHLHEEPQYRLVGIHGPDRGLLIPSLNEFFPYQPGDVMEFEHFNIYSMHIFRTWERFEITERSESPEHIELSGTSWMIPFSPGGQPWDNYSTLRTWMIDSATFSPLRTLYSWPGQLVDLGDLNASDINGHLMQLAKHKVDQHGNYEIGPGDQFEELFYLHEASDGCHPMEYAWAFGNELRLRSGFGVLTFAVSTGTGASGWSTTAAIIAGDTIGTLHDEQLYHVGMADLDQQTATLSPTPANDHIYVPGSLQGSAFAIHDLQGRTVLTGTLSSSQTIDLQALPTGSYILTPRGFAPERFMIVR